LRIIFYTILLYSVFLGPVRGQDCTTLGQNPSTAFPVCGTDTFVQSVVPRCGGRQILTPGCTDFLSDINPYWYRFTCFQSGVLGFTIVPNNPADDYDWQLFDITNRNPNDVYTDQSLFVACNWSGEPGTTGASSAGTSLTVCGSAPGAPFRPLFTSMPQLIQGHEYILLISHFSGSSQSGYGLSFGGGTAVITDPTIPALIKARAICDGTQMTIKLNKQMKCNSLSANGSEFVLNPPVARVISAVGVNCSNGFDMDSIVVTLDNPIPPGNYSLAITTGTDGNNLLDDCSREIADGQSLSVTVFPLFPTPMDSIQPLGCQSNELVLFFNKPMRCNSIARDGTDFRIIGPAGSPTVTSARGDCNSEGLSQFVRVSLSSPIRQAGNFRLFLQVGSDGNTLLNECGKETPAGSSLPFASSDTVNADFDYQIRYGCNIDTVFFSHNGLNGVNSWRWTFENGLGSSARDTSIIYTVLGEKKVTLTVSNGSCSDTATRNINLDNFLDARFESTRVVCPEDPAVFKDRSVGIIRGWSWTFGNGNQSNLQSPPNQFYQPGSGIREELIRLVVTDHIGCRDTAVSSITVAGNCFIAVPGAFSPNRDGLNDFLYPTNAYKATRLQFSVFNRLGQKVFETSDWTKKWDGTFQGNPQDPGTYVWFLRYTLIDSNEEQFKKGTTVLIR
jgi:gliding motility-associated-like protein